MDFKNLAMMALIVIMVVLGTGCENSADTPKDTTDTVLNNELNESLDNNESDETEGSATPVETRTSEFTKDMKISAWTDTPEMADFAEFLFFRPIPNHVNVLKEKTLLQVNEENPTWNAQSMEDGLNHLLNNIYKGIKVDYDIWTEEEKELEPEKKGTKLFYFPGEENKPFVLLNAGGGFTAVASMQESFPVAQRLNELGYNVFALSYRVSLKNSDDTISNAVEDEIAALSFIFNNAEQFKISTENYAVGGFSAGSMLTAEWAAVKGWEEHNQPEPKALFLVYGGIASDKITPEYPPTFIVYTEDDPIISTDSLVELQNTLNEKGVVSKTKSGKTGRHGFGLGEGTDVEGWVEEAATFWEEQSR